MWETCVATVRRDSSSRAAISGLDRPSSTNAAILISVAVRLSQPLCARRCLACGPRRMPWARNVGLQPGDVRGRAQRGVDLHGRGERGPRLDPVVGVDEVPGRRLQRLRPLQRPAGVLVALRRREQPGGIAVEQAAAVQRVRLPVRDLRSGGERVGVARQGLRGAQVAGLGRRGGRRRPAGPRSPRGPRYCRRTRRSARPAPPAARRPARSPGCGRAPAGRWAGAPIRLACGTAAARWLPRRAGLAAMEADHGGDAEDRSRPRRVPSGSRAGPPPRPARRPSAPSRRAAGPGRCAPEPAGSPCRPGRRAAVPARPRRGPARTGRGSPA